MKIYKNKLMLLLITLILGFMYVIFGNNPVSADYSTDLTVLANKIEAQEGKITEWSLYTRETMEFSSKKEWLEKAKELKGQFSSMNWELKDGPSGQVLTGTLKNHNNVEMIKLMSTPIKDKFQSYLIYELNGSTWNDQLSSRINDHVSKKLDALYDHKTVIFSCIKGEFNDKIDKVLSSKMDNLLTSLNAKEKEALKEKNFDSISAYSPLLSQSIPTKNTHMNMQIGFRKDGLGAKTNFVIGTPIITIEY